MLRVQRLLGSAAVAVLATAVGVPAFAADAGSGSVEEVVVTAQKREQNVQDVPISMEVVSGTKLAEFHTDTLKELSIPNLNVGAVGGNDAIYIRGFGSPSQNYGFDQSVSLYVDGVYAGKSRQFMSPFFDIQRVEVLRGPQGALFGKNTAAGAISIVSAQPTSTFQGAATGIYNFDQQGYELNGYVSGPITKDLSGRLAAKFVDQDGYIKNLAYGGREEPKEQSQMVRGMLRYAPESDFDYTAKVEYGHGKSGGMQVVSGPLDKPQQPVLTRYAIDDLGRLGPAGFESIDWNVSGTGNLKLGGFTLTSITAYSFFNAGHTNNWDLTNPAGGLVSPLPNVWNSFPEHFQQWSQELRLASPTGGRFDYIIGGYYDNSQYKVQPLADDILPAFGGAFLMASQFKQQAESYSFFGQGVYHLTDVFRAVGSLRYTHTSKRGSYTSAKLQGPFPLSPLTSANGTIDEGRVDPSLTLQYDVTPHVMVYATYGQGSKSGGFVANTSGTTDATFKFQPEDSKNYEVGAKTTLLDGRLVLDTAIYDIKFNNLQVSTYNPVTRAFIVGNAAKASGKGVEVTGTWYVLPNFDVTGSAAYQDVKYDDFPGASCLASQPITQCNPTVPASVAANNLAGSPLPNISKFSGSIQGRYVADLPNELKLATSVKVSGRSKFFNSDDQSPNYGLQPGYAKVDARIELYRGAHDWHLALVGTNLTNELTTEGAFKLPLPITAVARAQYFVDPPRAVSIEAGVKF
jgi:iron complex outermembrane receptor protein